MYGLVEVEVGIVRKAYRFLKNDKKICGEMEMRKSTPSIFKRIKGLMSSENEKQKTTDEIYSIEQRRQIREILAEIVYASYISTSEHMMIKIEIAGIIQDIIDMYEGQTIEVLNTLESKQENHINV